MKDIFFFSLAVAYQLQSSLTLGEYPIQHISAMVSFSCEVCNDTILKKKLQQHQRSCRGAYFTCIDCSTTFYGNDHQKHTSCISEAEKYEKSLYKGKKAKQPQQQPKKETKATPTPAPKKETNATPTPAPKKEAKTEAKKNSFDLSKYLDSNSTTLYKIFKSAKKDNKKLSDKTDFLKNIKVTKNEDGSFNLSL